MTKEHCVIIGNGPAANEAAFTLREKEPDLKITIIGKEDLPYYKPHLLPDFVAGKINKEDLYVNPFDLYREKELKLRLGQKVIDVDFSRHELILDHKEKIGFTGLIIAVGAKPRIPEPLQVFEDFLLRLKTINDAEVWRDKLAEVDSVLLIGGDLTSLSFTRALLFMGIKVYFILNEDSFWPVRFTDHVFGQVARRLRDKGVEVLECRGIKALAKISDHEFEVLINGTKLRIGALGAFYGLVPNVKFLAKSGLHIDRGILVNEFLATNFEGVYAAGDCAQVYHPGIRDYWVSIGYENARKLGKIAALNFIGERIPADMPPQSIFSIEGVTVNTSWWSEF